MGLLLCTTIHQHWTTATTTTAAAAESSRQQAAAAAAATGAGWGGGWQLLEHATRFWRIDKTSASDRETTHTHTMRVRAIHTHKHTFFYLYTCVCGGLCEIVAVVSAFTPTTKSTGLGCWCSLSLSHCLSLFEMFVVFAWLA